MTTKTCFKCLSEKPLEAFYKHPRMADGHLNKCKECAKNDVTANRVQNIERIRAYDKLRASMPHRVAARSAYMKTTAFAQSHKAAVERWAAKHPERLKASYMVGNAIRDGKLIRQPCLVCGGKSEAHHPDYSHPLDVVWLCPSHHKAAHAIARNTRTH